MIETVTLIELQELTTAPHVIIGEQTVGGFHKGDIYIRLGRTVSDSFTAILNFRIEGSPKLEGNHWNPLATTLTAAVGTSVAEEAVNGACLAGQNVVPMASTTGFIVGDVVFIENTTMENSEFGRIKVLTADSSVTLEDNLENVQTGSTVRDQAELEAIQQVDLHGVKRVRVVVDGAPGTKNFAIEVLMIGYTLTGKS